MKYFDFKKKLEKPLFTTQDIRLLGDKVFAYQLCLWQKQGYIIKLKNGVYVFTDGIGQVKPETIAANLYAPSYISLEKALSFYGLIPEMVYSITSVTPKTTRTFKNRLGNFTYQHLKPALFCGYREIKDGPASYLLAEPEKALLDYLYLHKIKDKKDWQGLRLNQKIINNTFRPKLFANYLRLFDNKKLTALCSKNLELK
ncbi:hypothetical protein A2291_08565 [candidate division WOR-1 bacterium RIFOXYB2_FULL_42_35]|uniref:AbiEi antitoxin C-terminal domain-containing protein n=1 Tax=candidate division WOR-1 bacterium RIFOXYC2_FULL_41_25 TaxID=1802586 RepID=A0A1F4TLN1_UNCSA|nr:MAG: hypothetical protein A2291_08565 [candidate division WOR-1 bacterium RIFOXYB2_FULL_42_35]OGC23060.1 MAG: hypothetical protein A2247_08465 [candidate division WOR-1 bacterium RIFOXYA2_FULL_41_14]OGC33632.1 MAG: hypothetical protein A2462_02155 [candidate division WOR-1 bacterium RIFOXYC2_FULL_41_25]